VDRTSLGAWCVTGQHKPGARSDIRTLKQPDRSRRNNKFFCGPGTASPILQILSNRSRPSAANTMGTSRKGVQCMEVEDRLKLSTLRLITTQREIGSGF